MRISVVKFFSLLVASGHGDRCNEMCSKLQYLLDVDAETGMRKVYLHKYGKKSYPEAFTRISKEVGKIMQPLTAGIPDIFFTSDIPVNSKSLN